MPIKDYSTDPDLNVQISGINIAEGCPPSGINNAIRQLMADVKTEKDERDTTQAAKDAEQDAQIEERTTAVEELLKNLVEEEKSALERQIRDVVPAGTVITFAANATPEGFLLCNGATVSRTTYSALFSAIGTTYGAGDGSTTFALPNLTDKFIQGSGTAGTTKEAGLPNLTGHATNVLSRSGTGFTVTGVYASAVTAEQFPMGSGNQSGGVATLGFNASRSNSIYGKSSTVQPPALTMRYYIKY